MKSRDNSILDEKIRTALLQAARRDYEELLDGESEEKIVWSTQYRRRRRKMLRDPHRYLRASLRSRWKRVLHMASVALVALCMVTGAVLLNPSSRAQLSQFFMQLFETYSKMIMNEPDSAQKLDDMEMWGPAWLPEGFEEVGIKDKITGYTYSYSNGTEFIYLDQTPATSEYKPGIDTEHAVATKVQINETKGTLFKAIDEDGLNYVFWIEETENTAFLLYGDVEPEVLIKVAESIEKK